MKVRPKAQPRNIPKPNDAAKVEQFEDTVKLNIMMRDILAYALKNSHKPSYKKSLKLWNFEYNSEAELTYGSLFTSADKYLVIKRKFYEEVIAIDVLKLEGDKFVKALEQAVMNNTFINSDIRDLDGDGFDDYFIHWYPSSGCCRRNAYDVYRYNNKSKKFENGINFVNPDFSPKEHVIRGVDYGHPGEVPLYKFKWNGGKLDTIEYIYPADTIKNKFYRVKRFGDKNDLKRRETLSAVPKEYRTLEDYDWFINY